MARYKTLGKKKRLARALKQNVPVPIWVVAKTLGKVRGRIISRNWRRSRMQL
ncbi:MAG: 50S ribosomal protein L39e [Thermoprotei archaeon]|nr:MAG: 50S ribosomal protein L39e [Thermofilum sp. ex4484_79]RLE61411.1 MAG: 50S ribosomal protein L39e [Thermoprotei archaeon]HDD64229.1 50S ribosomal protein L39e [Thermoprotei archaeon]